MPVTLMRGLSRAIADKRGDNAGAAGHVALHLFHAGRLLNRDAAGIKGDSLADQSDAAFALGVAAIVHHDELRGLSASLGDAEQRSHAELDHLLGVQHLALQPRLVGDGLRPRRHLGRRQVIAGFVGHVASQVGRFGKDHTGLKAAAQRINPAGVVFQHDQGFQLSPFLIRLLVPRKAVEAEQHSLADRSANRIGLEPAGPGPVGDGGGGAIAFVP